MSQRRSALELLDGTCSSEEVAAWLGRISRPPTMQNREGHDLVFCTRTLRPVGIGWEGLAGVLDRAFESGADGTWLAFVDIDGERMVRATMRRNGDDLVVETNSVRRDEEMSGRLADLDGVSFEVVDRVRTPTGDHLSAPPPAGSTGIDGDESSDVPDEIRRLMDDLMVRQETSWVDESVPTLGGLSPREALDNPSASGGPAGAAGRVRPTVLR